MRPVEAVGRWLVRVGSALLDWWFAPVRAVRLRTFEKAFALSFILYMGAWLHGAEEWLTTVGFHYPLDISDRSFSEPLPPLAPWMLGPFVAILLGAPLLVILDRWRKPALLVTLACAFYVQRVDTYSAFTINKLFIVGFLVLLLAPPAVSAAGAPGAARAGPPRWSARVVAAAVWLGFAGWLLQDGDVTWVRAYALLMAAFAVIALAFWPRTPEVGGDPAGATLWQSAWPLRILQATLLIQYGTAGVCKIVSGDWMDFPGQWFVWDGLWPDWRGGSIDFKGDILVGHSVGLYRTEAAAWLIDVLPRQAWVLQGMLALGFELFAPVLFMVRRLRPLAYLLGVGMHVVIALMMVDLIWFSLQMVTFYILFVDGRRLARFDGWMKGRARRGPA